MDLKESARSESEMHLPLQLSHTVLVEEFEHIIIPWKAHFEKNLKRPLTAFQNPEHFVDQLNSLLDRNSDVTHWQFFLDNDFGDYRDIGLQLARYLRKRLPGAEIYLITFHEKRKFSRDLWSGVLDGVYEKFPNTLFSFCPQTGAADTYDTFTPTRANLIPEMDAASTASSAEIGGGSEIKEICADSQRAEHSDLKKEESLKIKKVEPDPLIAPKEVRSNELWNARTVIDALIVVSVIIALLVLPGCADEKVTERDSQEIQSQSVASRPILQRFTEFEFDDHTKRIQRAEDNLELSGFKFEHHWSGVEQGETSSYYKWDMSYLMKYIHQNHLIEWTYALRPLREYAYEVGGFLEKYKGRFQLIPINGEAYEHEVWSGTKKHHNLKKRLVDQTIDLIVRQSRAEIGTESSTL